MGEWRGTSGDHRVSKEALPELAQVYQAYHAKVRAYASKLIGADEADDVAQEVFVKAGRALGTLTDPAKLSSWIYAITLNTVRDLARKRSVGLARLIARDEGGPDAEGDGSPLPIEDARTPSPEQSAIRSEMIACYLDYVSRLPRRYYQVYVLSEFEELSSQAIARRLSVSVGAVKIRLHRARARLYQELRRNCRCYRNERGELMGEPK
jgi:RNA polymerase sigma-70 factor (ECF subfamily)